MDGELYGTVDPGEGFFSSGLKHSVKHATQWSRGTAMAPLDEMVFCLNYTILSTYQCPKMAILIKWIAKTII